MVKEKKEAVYTIPLKRVYWGRRSNRAARAVKYIRFFIARHFGVDVKDVIIGNDVNEYVWRRGIEKPPRYVRVYARKLESGEEREGREGEKVLVMLAREKTSSSRHRSGGE